MSVERPHEDRLGTTGGAVKVLTWTGTGVAAWSTATGGAPTTADYLVGTAQGGLSAEIVVGATPGGELGGTWASPTVDATHSGSAHHAESHTARHAAGGADPLKLDDLAAPDDNTDLNVSASAHGLMSKLPGGSTNFLREDGTWASPPGGSSGVAVSDEGTPLTGTGTTLDFVGAGVTASGGAGTKTITIPGGGITSGTSFPGSPADGDLFYRSDLDLLCRYRSTGTRWVTVQQYVTTVLAQTVVIPLSASQSFYGPLPNNVYDLWIESIYSPTQVNTTNNATNYWTFQYQRFPSATNIGASFSTAADGTGSAVGHTVTVGALSGTADRIIGVTMIKTLSPGVLYNFGATVMYRMVIT